MLAEFVLDIISNQYLQRRCYWNF